MSAIVVEQRIEAPPPTVYQYLTQSDLWSKWQGSTAVLDPKRGGIFSFAMPDGMRARGQFTELVPHERVVFTWGWVDRPGIPPGSTVVTIELVPERGGTLLKLTHADLPADEIDAHSKGWQQMLPNLANLASSDT